LKKIQAIGGTKMTDIYIQAVSHYVPSGRMTNEQVMKMLEDENRFVLSDEELKFVYYGNKRKLEFLGGSTRSFCTDGEGYVDMAVNVAKGALEKAGIKASEIDCLIATGISNPIREPSLSIIIAHEIGMENGIFFDITDACNGFMQSVRTACLYLKSGICRNALVVACESPLEVKESLKAGFEVEHISQIDNRFSNLMIGTGAGAVLLGCEGDRRRLVNLDEKMESKDWDASIITFPDVKIPETRYGKTRLRGFWTDARNISSIWRRGTVKFIQESVEKWNIHLDDIDIFLLHQLGDNITFSILKQIGVDKTKAPLNTFNEYGNLASANIPVLMSIAEEKGIVKEGTSVLLASGGGGFSYSAAHLIW